MNKIETYKLKNAQLIDQLEHAKLLIYIVKKYTNIDPVQTSRKRNVVDVKHLAMWLVYDNTWLNYSDIAELFGMKTHVAALWAINKVNNLIINNKSFVEKYIELIKLRNHVHTQTPDGAIE